MDSNKKEDLRHYINLKLVARGFEPVIYERKDISKDNFVEIANNLIRSYRVKNRLLPEYYCPVDQRIHAFLKSYFSSIAFVNELNLPHESFILDQSGLARELSLPPNKNEFFTPILKSYRIKQGILHNPLHDRRTTKGTFHIVEGGLPIPIEKKEVPKIVFANLFKEACSPPEEMLTIPFTAFNLNPARTFVSLLLRPIVSPKVKKKMKEKKLEVRFFAPGNLVSNLDFVESIFGNGGNPNLPSNDAALDIEHWTGTTGCVILAPHLVKTKKKDLGLPHLNNATKRQKRDGMFWLDPAEYYNEGIPFKISCRDEKGIVITLIADNYFGYSKKEIKTQISYSANLIGLVEEEHAGGALAFPRRNIGTVLNGKLFDKKMNHNFSFEDIKKNYHPLLSIKKENYAIDKRFKNIIYLPEYCNIKLLDGKIDWREKDKIHSLPLLPNHYYVLPSGYKIHIEKHPEAPSWRLVSTNPLGTFCHKPCTVSGGGKSEISKPLVSAIIYKAFFLHHINEDFEFADRIINYDYSYRFIDNKFIEKKSRSLLNPDRTLGSVIKLLTPSDTYTKEYNEFIQTIPPRIKGLVFLIKRFYRPNIHKENWKNYFSVDIINGRQGKELIFEHRRIIASYLRIGFANDNTWFLHKLRADFLAAAKIQMEDDISASITLPEKFLDLKESNRSIKLLKNCEKRLFQRPDDAIIRGYDKETEAHLSMRGNFISNYEPLTVKDAKKLINNAVKFVAHLSMRGNFISNYEALTVKDAKKLINNAVKFDLYTKSLQNLIKDGAKEKEGSYFITPSHPRIVNNLPTKNPRYLQIRPDLLNPLDKYLADIGIRFAKIIPLDKPIYNKVDSVLASRRNNPPDKAKGIRALSVYNPIHYQELPELFMDFISSLTGKSPSTTGAGSEGALTKGPFNMLVPITDLNNSLLSYILTGFHGYTSCAGYIGVDNRFDHDISFLVPEIWCRLSEEEQNPKLLIKEGSLEKLNDFEYNGKKVLASRLGYRITPRFMFRYANRIFDEPQAVFNEYMLKPEVQCMETFVDGVNNIVEAHQRIALNYFKNNTVEGAIPPLKVLLHIMAYGKYNNSTIEDEKIRQLFDREYVIASDWYKERLLYKQKIDKLYYNNQIQYIQNFIENPINKDFTKKLNLEKRLTKAKDKLDYIKSQSYLNLLVGTIGADTSLVKEDT